MTIIDEIKQILRDVAIRQAETDKRLDRIAILSEQNVEQQAESDRRQAETDRQIQRVDKQLGELGNKWGSFTEGLLERSVQRIMVKDLGITDTSFGASKYKNGKTIEIDVLGVSNGTNNRVVIAEIKSHLRETAIEQIQQQLNDYLYFAPEHKDKELLGLIACISAAPNIIQQALKAGLIVLIVNDNLLEYYSTNKQYTIKDYNLYDEL
jgi:hypothetical protein